MTQGFNFPIPRPRGTPDQQAAAMAQNLRELEVWLNKFVRTGTVIDHGGLVGLADDDHTNLLNEARHDALAADNPHSVTFAQAVTADAGTDISAAEAETLTDTSNADGLHVHAAAALSGVLKADGSVDSTGTQRFTADPAVIYGGAGAPQVRWNEVAAGWVLELGNIANVFTPRFELNTSDHADAGDMIWYDANGTTERSRWDESAGDWIYNADLVPGVDNNYNLGTSLLSWKRLYAFSLFDPSNVEIYKLDTARFLTAQEFASTVRIDGVTTFGAAGDAQFQITEDADSFLLQTLSNANAVTNRMRFFTADDANAHDTVFFKGDGSSEWIRWDDSISTIIAGGNIDPLLDVTNDLGDGLLTWRRLYIDAIYDRAAGLAIDVQNRNFQDTWTPSIDVTYDLGTALLTFRRFYVDNLRDRAGVQTYDVQTATFSTAHIFASSIEIDGDLNHDGSNVGFYGTAPVALQTGVAVDSTGIHAALVALGLITA